MAAGASDSDDIAAVCQALGHPARVRLVRLLAGGERCVCDLVTALEEPQSTVSRQLAILRDAGLVEARRDGRWVHYRWARRLDATRAALLAALAAGPGEPTLPPRRCAP